MRSKKLLIIAMLFIWTIIAKDTMGSVDGPISFFVLENEKGERRVSKCSFLYGGYLYVTGDKVNAVNWGNSSKYLSITGRVK